MNKILLLLTGGAIGTIARYGLSGLTHRCFKGTYPLGTLVVNLFGSLVIGLLWGIWENGYIHTNLRTFIFIGLLGGFTTFSTYMLESLNLFRDGETKMALINIFAHNILGLSFVFIGFIMAKELLNFIRS
ncbi:MAG: hypothetical protein APR63_11690 [Desulfuromonas sp. SDB]|nr:MAG: hypothetical protein APR63_11690 [Desulfuromonas sp. SDB]